MKYVIAIDSKLLWIPRKFQFWKQGHGFVDDYEGATRYDEEAAKKLVKDCRESYSQWRWEMFTEAEACAVLVMEK